MDPVYISKITLPSGTTYDIKDAEARISIASIQSAITGGIVFIGETTTALTDGSTTNPITINNKSVTAVQGNLTVYGNKEFVWDGSKWIEMGDLSLLGSLAYKNSASGTVTDYATGISGASYTPSGTVSVTFKQTATAATLTSSDYTPAGSVQVLLSQTATSAAITSSDYTPAGSVSVVLSTKSINQITSVGKSGTFNAGSYSAPSVSESAKAFTVEGLVATVSSETLTFASASTANAIYATNFNAGSYSAPSFTGFELPSLSAVTLATDVSSATFSGTKENNLKVTAVSYSKATLSSATFSGTKATNLKVTSVSYSKATLSSATFSGTSSTITPTLTTSSKTITVS